MAALAALTARGQTDIWDGGGSDSDFSDPTNWENGVVPPDTGTDLVELSVTGFDTLTVDTDVNVSGIQVDGTNTPRFTFNAGTGTLTLGALGIFPVGTNSGPVITFNVPVVLGADQTWTSSSGSATGFVSSNTGISGAFTLTVGAGQVYIYGTNTYANLVVSGSGTFHPGTNSAAGIGTLTLQDNSRIVAPAVVTLGNAVTLGNNVLLGDTDPGENLELSGTITAQNGATVTNIGASSSVTLSGMLTGTAETDFIFDGPSAQPLGDGGARLVFSGTTGLVNSITANNSTVILAPATANPLASYTGLAGGFQVTAQGYLGLDGTFTAPGGVSGFFSTFAPAMATLINGTIGFDSVESSGPTNTFTDPVNLSSFSLDSGFFGIGSSTKAVLAGSITPTGPGAGGNAYLFGGGGGTLVVTSDLEDFGGTELFMSSAAAPLTLILRGANNYTGGVAADGGVLIFDSAALPGSHSIILNGGYVGDTEASAQSSTAFVGRFSIFGSGVIGFDQHTPDLAAPRQIADTIDLSGFNSEGGIFLGTSTAAELTVNAVIVPTNADYEFTGVKGGVLTVDTALSGANSVTIGLVDPIESNASVSTVKLTGNNSYTGGTTFNSGVLLVDSSTAFGAASGAINVPDTAATSVVPELVSYGGAPVTVQNPISVGSTNQHTAQGLTLGNSSPVGNDMLILSGVISDQDPSNLGLIAINGPVTLTAANTYSGGTIFTGSGTALALVGNPAAFGAATGTITVDAAATIAPFANVTVANPIVLEGGSTLNLGKSANTFVLSLNGAISGNGGLDINSSVVLNGANSYTGSTLINDANVALGSEGSFGDGPVSLTQSSLTFAGSSTLRDLSSTDSSSTVVLSPGETVTFDADDAGGNFLGSILGNMTNTVVKGGSGIQIIGGNSTYAGGTEVAAGTLIAGSANALGTGPVAVADGAQLGVGPSATLSLPITLSGNATLSGSGTFSPVAGITFSGSNTVRPGTAISGMYVSTLSFGTAVTFGTGGVYSLNIATAGGAMGTDYSTIRINSTLSIDAAPGSFTIGLNSIAPGFGPGLANFNSSTAYSWTIITATGGISGFDPALFAFNTANFQNSLGGGGLSLSQSGDTLTLNFTPIPEPATWILLLGGVAATGVGFRLCGRRTASRPSSQQSGFLG